MVKEKALKLYGLYKSFTGTKKKKPSAADLKSLETEHKTSHIIMSKI